MIPSGKATFYRLTAEEVQRKKERGSIGLLAEKRLHSVLKRWVTDDFSRHEVRVRSETGGKRFAVADVCLENGEVAEIQTGALYPLCRKMDFYMNDTNRRVTLIHPVLTEKHVTRISPEGGTVGTRRRSPKRETVLAAAGQLKPFAKYFETGRFEVWFVSLAAEEFRLSRVSSRGKGRGSRRFELIPTELFGVTVLKSLRDLLPLLPEDLPARFTAKEFAARVRPIDSFALYDLLFVLEEGGLLQKCGKEGRSAVYEKRY